jgi:CYTH domain-containing protein
MGIEIERKFLLKGSEWKKLTEGVVYRQGYISSDKEKTVRIRTVGDVGYLTIKGASKGAVRMEYEYEIPVQDALVMLEKLCQPPVIEKKRYCVRYKGFIWEIDEFFKENEGLVVAEIELEDEHQSFEKPGWVGEEVTEDSRYFNANLARHPYSSWKD